MTTELLFGLYIFALAAFLGHHVISKVPALLHTQSQNFFLTYPQLVSKAMTNFLRVDGTTKREKEKTTFRSFLAARSLTGLVGDAFRLARAWR
jgi:electron transfer flavoprotein-quinone oxidoreductase